MGMSGSGIARGPARKTVREPEAAAPYCGQMYAIPFVIRAA